MPQTPLPQLCGPVPGLNLLHDLVASGIEPAQIVPIQYVNRARFSRLDQRI